MAHIITNPLNPYTYTQRQNTTPAAAEYTTHMLHAIHRKAREAVQLVPDWRATFDATPVEGTSPTTDLANARHLAYEVFRMAEEDLAAERV